MWPIIRSTPDARPGTAPDEKTEMRYLTRASESVHRRLWVLPSPLHDPSLQELHDETSWRWETVPCVLDWGHQNGMARLPARTVLRTLQPPEKQPVDPAPQPLSLD